MKILILAGETKRTLCYLNALSNIKSIEVEVLLYGFSNNKIEEQIISNDTIAYLNKNKIPYPTYHFETYEELVLANNWKIGKEINREVNTDEIISYLNKSNADIVIFSGYGGQILKHPGFFKNNFRLLHMHPGDIPSERGSTTMYYSILNKNPFTVTAFFMTETIDQGQIVFKEHYPLPEKLIELDSWTDPLLRSDCMIKAISTLNESNTEIGDNLLITNDKNEEYYVIHPLLKHISLLTFKS